MKAESLVGRLTTDPEIIALLADLGVDVGALKRPDELCGLALPELGCQFEFGWPWDFPNKRLEALYPRDKRAGMQKGEGPNALGRRALREGDQALEQRAWCLCRVRRFRRPALSRHQVRR